MGLVKSIIQDVRVLRKDFDVDGKQLVPIVITRVSKIDIEAHESTIRRLAKVSDIFYQDGALFGANVRSTFNFDVAIVYEKVIDPAAETLRLNKDLAQQEKEFANNQRQLSNEAFLAKAPPHVVEGLRTRAAELTVLLEKNRAALAALPAKV